MSGLHAAVGSRGQVMIVDDEPFVAHALSLFLSDEHEVTVLHDAREALARLAAGETFDVILCDVMMPDMSGFDFHRRLVADFPEHAARVVFVTGGIFRSEDRAYLDTLSNECIDKPPNPFALRTLVRERVALRRAGSAHARQIA